MLARMRKACPRARIWCLTLLPGREPGTGHAAFAYRLRGIDLDDYNEVIRTVAAANGCLVADVRAAGFDYEASDGTHPTERGMEQLAALVVAAMESGGTAAGQAVPSEVFAGLPADLFPDEMRSERRCERETCFGCEFARGTGAVWSCVCDLP